MKYLFSVPVEYAGAYHPDNFYNAYPVSSGLGGYVAAPSAAYPYRSVVHPWYQLVSPEVPILTLYPADSDESYRGSGMSCADPTVRYIHGANHPMMYGGPAAASPYAANQFAAASLANMGVAGNPNPYGTHVPYYKISYIPEASSYTPSEDYLKSTLISPASKVSPISSISSISSPPRLSPISSFFTYPGSSNFYPNNRQISPLDSITFYPTNVDSGLNQLIHV